VRVLLAVAITWIAVHLAKPARARVRYPESPDVHPADPACVRRAVWALQYSNFHADIVSAGTICRRDATVAVREGWDGVGLSPGAGADGSGVNGGVLGLPPGAGGGDNAGVGLSGGVTLAADVKATAATIVIMVGRCRLTL